MNPPLCFILMPFGSKPDGMGGTIDFDAVYKDLTAPAIEDAGMEPLSTDEEVAGGIHPQAHVRTSHSFSGVIR